MDRRQELRKLEDLAQQFKRTTISHTGDGRQRGQNSGSHTRDQDAWTRIPQNPSSRLASAPPLATSTNRRYSPPFGNRQPVKASDAAGRAAAPNISLMLVDELSEDQANLYRVTCLKEDSMLYKKLEHIGVFDKSGFSFKVTVESRKRGSQTDFSLVLWTTCELYYGQKKKLWGIFEHIKSLGFAEWLGGATGWRFDSTPDNKWKRRSVFKLNTLQSVFALFASDEQKYLFPNDSKKLTWKKNVELTSVVSDIRVWIESIEPRTYLTHKLLRSSNEGPNALVNWAHHHPRNGYPLTVVTEQLMEELVNGVINLFIQQFENTREKPLGSTWRSHPKRRVTDWKDAGDDFPEWTEDLLERKLNGRM